MNTFLGLLQFHHQCLGSDQVFLYFLEIIEDTICQTFLYSYLICYFVNLNRILFSDDLLHEGRLKTPI